MKKLFGKVISILLVAVMVLCAAPLAGFVGLDLSELNLFGTKAEAATSGTCGKNLSWSLDTSTGVLNITGSGAMTDFSYSSPWYSYHSYIKTVNIPNGVTTIGNWSFFLCENLTNITIPNSIKTIGEEAFGSCYSLKSITIPNSVTSIGIGAFDTCYNLSSVAIPNSVITIGGNAFYDCNSLTSVTIPNSVTTIGMGAFYSCDGLTNITIPNSVTSIGSYAFASCINLTSVTIGNGVTTIGEFAFTRCNKLASITIGNSITTIGAGAFDSCSSLTNVKLPDSVTTIAAGTFYSCTSLTGITIGKKLSTIGDSAFRYCSSLKSLTIPNSVTDIGWSAFGDCTAFTDIYYNGIEAQWKKIKIDTGNEPLLNATIHYIAMNFAQTHVISDYISKNDDYIKKYFEGNGIPLDGSNGTVDMCVPGLNREDDMIPQGITYYPQKNWFLISAYASSGSKVKNRPSVIYALDFDTGKYVGEYKLYNSDGSAHTKHVGGIAVSGNNLYITDEGGAISYIPLSELNAANGTSKSIKFVDSYSVSSLLNGASTSHLSYSDGYLWTGNFYHTKDNFDIPASKTNNSLVLGFKLSGTNSESEWNNLKAKSVSDYTFKIPNSISKIQGTAVSLKNNKMILMSSYGRGNASTVYTVDISDNNISNEDISSMTGIPMLEGAVIFGDYVYTVTESASWYYNGYDPNDMSKDPTDVIWRFCYNTSTFHNSTTDISIEYIDNGIGKVDFLIDETKDNTVVEIINFNLNSTQKTVYDIKMTVDGVETQPDGNVKIRIPLPEGYNPWLSTVVYVNSAQNRVERIPSMYIDGYMVFITDHFSYYAVVEETCVIKTPSTTTISYGDSIVLHADITESLSDGWYIEWTASNDNFSYSADGTTCTITPSSKGDTTFTATVYDANGKAVSTDEQTMTSKAGFFDKIIAFFKKLFGLTKTIPQIYNGIF